jgi:hypothetical protein
MRTIVVGPLNTTNGIQQIAVWFRFPRLRREADLLREAAGE